MHRLHCLHGLRCLWLDHTLVVMLWHFDLSPAHCSALTEIKGSIKTLEGERKAGRGNYLLVFLNHLTFDQKINVCWGHTLGGGTLPCAHSHTHLPPIENCSVLDLHTLGTYRNHLVHVDHNSGVCALLGQFVLLFSFFTYLWESWMSKVVLNYF